MRSFLPIALFISSCSAISQKQVEVDLLKTAAAAGEGFLLGGEAGAIAYGTRQELLNFCELKIADKNPVRVTP
jgi:hypothetical protein